MSEGAFQPRSSQPIAGEKASRELALRTHPLVFGVVLFLASELMFFGGLLAAYFNLRETDAVWPPAGVQLDTLESAIGTGLLACSSGTMLFFTHYVAQNRARVARLWLGATIVLGIAFELIALHGWVRDPFRIDSHAYGTVFFALTGFHFLHVLVGIMLLAVLLVSLKAAAFERDRRAAVEAIGYYWHFVFGVWLLVWGTLYFVR